MAFNFIKTLSGNIAIIGITTCLFSDFAFACASLVCDNGILTNGCSLENNKNNAEWYFNVSFLLLIISIAVKILTKSKNYFFVVFSFFGVFIAPLFRFFQGGESCNFTATEIAKCLFLVSLISLFFQIFYEVISKLKNNEVLK